MNNYVINITVNSSSNNTILNAAIENDKNIILSAGNLGFKGAKRSAAHAAQQTAELLGDKLIENQISKAILVFKGIGKGRKSVLKGLSNKKIKIVKFIDKTPKAHNGCRAKKKKTFIKN